MPWTVSAPWLRGWDPRQLRYGHRCESRSESCSSWSWRSCRVCHLWVCRDHRLGHGRWFRCNRCPAELLEEVRSSIEAQEAEELRPTCSQCGAGRRPLEDGRGRLYFAGCRRRACVTPEKFHVRGTWVRLEVAWLVAQGQAVRAADSVRKSGAPVAEAVSGHEHRVRQRR